MDRDTTLTNSEHISTSDTNIDSTSQSPASTREAINNIPMTTVKYNADIRVLYRIWFKNIILEIITFMIYRPWAKTRIRKYVYRSFSVNGESLEYTGNGGELFKGLIKVSFALIFFFFVLFLLMELVFAMLLDPITYSSFQSNLDIKYIFNILLQYLVIFCLLYFSQFSALGYRLNRISWRGIRGRLTGSALSYMRYRMGRSILNIITLGYLVGRSDLKARRFIVERMSWGNQECKFDYNIKSLDKINFLTGTFPFLAGTTIFVMTSNANLFFLMLFVVTPLARIFYRAELLNAKIDCIRCGNISFRGTHTGGSLFRLYFVNIALLGLSLGLLTPRVINRTMEYFSTHIVIIGDIDKLYASSVASQGNTTGEGIDEAVDIDTGIDFDMGLI